jgi:hypothetical protein
MHVEEPFEEFEEEVPPLVPNEIAFFGLGEPSSSHTPGVDAPGVDDDDRDEEYNEEATEDDDE